MPNEPIPHDQAVTPAASSRADGDGDDQQSVKAAIAPENAAEQFRRLAEEARENGERQRTAVEVHRQERERLQEGAEVSRALSEEVRVAADTVTETRWWSPCGQPSRI
jgi:hypothetical protein